MCTLYEAGMHLRSMKTFFFTTLLFVFFISCERTRETLPSEDRRVLNEFFELLIKDHNFAYTLFGTKPISIAGYNGMNPTSFETLILERGWASWCKYKHFFPSRYFELRQVDLGRQNGICYKEIVLINKQATLNIIRKNIRIFRDYLENDWSSESIMKTILEDDNLFKKLTDRSDIFGILLGYGNLNASNFEKRIDLSLHINEETSPPFYENLEGLDALGQLFVKGYGKSKLDPNSKLSLDLPTSKEELHKVIKALGFFELDQSDYLLDNIQPIVFAADMNDEETKWLKQNYSETRNKIIDAYSNQSIFEVTMNQWMKN